MRLALRLMTVLLVLGLVGCATKPRTARISTTTVNADFYTVRAGDTLSSIARQHGQSVETLQRLNKLNNPNHIRRGQVLRVRGNAPTQQAAQARPLPRATPPPSLRSTPPPSTPAISLVWPAQGTVNRNLPKPSPHGFFILGKAGSTIHAVAPGQVIYAGEGLRGYGKLLIVRHAAEYLSVYAHNRSLSVTEGQQVRQGQKIAEMGNTESRQVGLYFELRHQGKPINANSLLPSR